MQAFNTTDKYISIKFILHIYVTYVFEINQTVTCHQNDISDNERGKLGNKAYELEMQMISKKVAVL